MKAIEREHSAAQIARALLGEPECEVWKYDLNSWPQSKDVCYLCGYCMGRGIEKTACACLELLITTMLERNMRGEDDGRD